MAVRGLLSQDKIDADALKIVSNYHAEVVNSVRQAVERDAVVVVGMAGNPFVKKARAALEAAKIEFRYLEYGSYWSKWRPRLAIKLWSGWPTFPQVFVRGTLIGGFEQLSRKIDDGSLQLALK